MVTMFPNHGMLEPQYLTPFPLMYFIQASVHTQMFMQCPRCIKAMFPIPKRENKKMKIYTSWNTGQMSIQVYDLYEVTLDTKS